MLKPNVGSFDRTLRIVVGLLLIAYGIITGSWLGAIGIIPLATGLIRWCPAYCPLGISTSREWSSAFGPNEHREWKQLPQSASIGARSVLLHGERL